MKKRSHSLPLHLNMGKVFYPTQQNDYTQVVYHVWSRLGILDGGKYLETPLCPNKRLLLGRDR